MSRCKKALNIWFFSFKTFSWIWIGYTSTSIIFFLNPSIPAELKLNIIKFTLNEVNTAIKCSKDDKMDDICQRYAMEINKNKDKLIFLYELILI